MKWFKRNSEAEEAEETQRLVQHAAAMHGVPASEVVHTLLDEDDDELDEVLDEEPRRRGLHLGMWVTFVLIGGVFGFGIIFLYHLANGAAEAGPSAEAGMEAIKKSIAPTPPNLPTLTGQYVSFSYPQVFDSVKTMDNLPTSAERYAIGSKANYRRTIIVTVENNTPSLDEDSGYKYRSITPSLYHVESAKVAGGPAAVMVKNDKTERTLYWLHAGKLVIVSVTSTNAGDGLEAYMAVIAGTLRWAR